MTIREILEELVKHTKEDLDIDITFSMSNIIDISQAEKDIKKWIRDRIPKKKKETL